LLKTLVSLLPATAPFAVAGFFMPAFLVRLLMMLKLPLEISA
jgi:hypothetical protein